MSGYLEFRTSGYFQWKPALKTPEQRNQSKSGFLGA